MDKTKINYTVCETVRRVREKIKQRGGDRKFVQACNFRVFTKKVNIGLCTCLTICIEGLLVYPTLIFEWLAFYLSISA